MYKHADAFVLVLFTGMRIGEATALTAADVDLEKRRIHIHRTSVAYYDMVYSNVFNRTHRQKYVQRPLFRRSGFLQWCHRLGLYGDNNLVRFSMNKLV